MINELEAQNIRETLDNLRADHEVKCKRVLREKMTLLQRADSDPIIRNMIMVRASRDIQWFCNTWIVTYNPRAKPYKLLPFVLFPEQEAMLDWICLLYTSPSPRDKRQSRMPSSA